MEWRPRGWDIIDYPIEYCEHIIAITNAFEVGADAIIQALYKEIGNKKIWLDKAEDGHILIHVTM